MDLDQFRSSAASIAAPGARALFRLTTYLDLPPLPGHAAASSRHSMANLLEELIDAAGCNEIPAPFGFEKRKANLIKLAEEKSH